MTLVWGFAREELARWRRTPTRLLLVFMPLLATAACLWVYSGRVARHMPVAVVDMDHSGLSRTLARDMASAPQMSVTELADVESARQALRRGEIRAAAILPEGMDREVRQGRSARVVFWRDASNPSAANQLYSVMSTIVASESGRLSAGRLAMSGLPLSQAVEMVLPLRSDPRGMDNPNFDYLANFAPGLFPMFLMMGLLLAGASLFPRAWALCENPWREFLGRGVPWVVCQMAIALPYYLWFVPSLGAVHAPLLPTMALSLLLVTGALSTGFLVGRASFSTVLAVQTMLAFSTPAFLLSGYTFPEWAFPEVLNRFTRPFPFSLFMDSYRGFAGWASDLAWKGMGELALWTIVPVLLLAIPARRRGTKERVHPPIPNPSTTMTRALRLEFRQICKTLGLALMFFVAPLEYFALYGSVFLVKSESHVPIAVVNAQSSALSREITRGLQAHPNLLALPMGSELDAEEALRTGKVRAILELPVDLDLRLRRRESTLVPLVFTTDRFLPANDIQRAVSAVLMERGDRERVRIIASRGVPLEQAREMASPLLLEDRPLANPHETYGDFMLPLLGILILHQVTLTSTAFATTLGAWGLRNFVARILLYTGWIGMWTLVWFAGAMPLLGVPLQPHVLPMVGLSLLGLLGVGSMGVFLGRVLKDPMSALFVLPFTSYPFLFLSGSSWPREAFPTTARWVLHLVPASPWLVGANRALRLDAGFSDLAPEFLNLALLVAAWGLLAAFASRRLRCSESRPDLAHRSDARPSLVTLALACLLPSHPSAGSSYWTSHGEPPPSKPSLP